MSNKRISKRIMSLLMAAGIVATSFVSAPEVEAASLNNYGLATNIKDGNILHCFEAVFMWGMRALALRMI